MSRSAPGADQAVRDAQQCSIATPRGWKLTAPWKPALSAVHCCRLQLADESTGSDSQADEGEQQRQVRI